MVKHKRLGLTQKNLSIRVRGKFAVVIVPMTRDRRLVLIRQERSAGGVLPDREQLIRQAAPLAKVQVVRRWISSASTLSTRTRARHELERWRSSRSRTSLDASRDKNCYRSFNPAFRRWATELSRITYADID